MDRINGASMNIVADNIAKLKEIFPEVFCEDKVDFQRLKEVLGNYIDDKEERYRFEWNGKSNAIRIAQTPSTGTLRPCKEESKDWDTTQNLYIEGDNLEVLKLLQKSYQNKIKMIYIDPPYNTGKDFVYKDNYKDNISNYLAITKQIDYYGNKISSNSETGGRFHTDWLNMMYPRLRLAKNLLTDDGLIFISIDDNELDNLKKICGEIFGENNFKGQISRATGTPTGQGTDRLVNEIDYILVYSKSSNAIFNGLPFSSEDEKIYNQEDSKGKYLTRPLRKTGGEDRREDRPSMYYPVISPSGEEIFPIAPSGYKSRWRCAQNRYKELIEDGLIEWKKSEENGKEIWKPYQKFYLEGRLKQPSNLWIKIDGNKKATREVKELLGNSVFDFPKPIELLKQCIRIGANKDSIILDFFSGSSTMANSVIEQNFEDNGKRRFIMVQLPQKIEEKSEALKLGYQNICEIGKERIRRAGDKILKENTDRVEDLDIGFKVFKLDASNLKKWNPNYDDLEQSFEDILENFIPDRTEYDIVYEIMLKYGIDLTYPVQEKVINDKKVYSIGFGALIICLDDNITLDVVNGIVDIKEELEPEICRVVFKDNGFATDSVKTNAVQILKRNNIKEVMSI